MQAKKILSWSGGLSLACVLVASATAQTVVDAGGSAGTKRMEGFSKPVSLVALGHYRGGSQIVRNDMALTGTTSDNTAQQVSTGNNAISSGAFTNMNGIPVVIQNSGANVLIQNAVILHLQMN
ncbi:hypothetical protein [Rhodoferax sp. WC2427]|uniref:hypothetical protein n=1 Tax=Rhodoferax sp. WC2427 TaxID=3234144 RepID=UPI0034670013